MTLPRRRSRGIGGTTQIRVGGVPADEAIARIALDKLRLEAGGRDVLHLGDVAVELLGIHARADGGCRVRLHAGSVTGTPSLNLPRR
jgi:hypothetical protein